MYASLGTRRRSPALLYTKQSYSSSHSSRSPNLTCKLAHPLPSPDQEGLCFRRHSCRQARYFASTTTGSAGRPQLPAARSFCTHSCRQTAILNAELLAQRSLCTHSCQLGDHFSRTAAGWASPLSAATIGTHKSREAEIRTRYCALGCRVLVDFARLDRSPEFSPLSVDAVLSHFVSVCFGGNLASLHEEECDNRKQKANDITRVFKQSIQAVIRQHTWRSNSESPKCNKLTVIGNHWRILRGPSWVNSDLYDFKKSTRAVASFRKVAKCQKGCPKGVREEDR